MGEHAIARALYRGALFLIVFIILVLVLHELTPQQASLEEAFMTLTRDDVEFKAADLESEEAVL